MITTIYDSNKTMKLLGRQYYNRVCNKEIFKEIQDIAEAYIEAKKPLYTRGGYSK